MTACETQPVITTLRPPTAADVDSLHQVLGRADVMANYVDLPDHTAGWTVEQTKALADDTLAAWTINTNGQVIGGIWLEVAGWLHPPLPYAPVGLSYYLHPGHWGHGHATAASQLVLGSAFRLGLPEVVCCWTVANQASGRVAHRLGFTVTQQINYHSPWSGASAVFTVARLTATRWVNR